LRRWLPDLIVKACSARALDVFVEQLRGSDDALRSIAVRSLARLDTKASRQLRGFL
jgi:hypothetical protein